MNLVSFWDEYISKKEMKLTQTSAAKDCSFYNNCFQDPYQQLVQFLKTAAPAKPLTTEVFHIAGFVLYFCVTLVITLK